MPLSELTMPVVTVKSEVSSPWNGKPIATTESLERIERSQIRANSLNVAVDGACNKAEIVVGVARHDA